MVAGTLLTARGTFLTRPEATQLLYACCSPTRPGLVDERNLGLPPPAMRKPRLLWTGKQARVLLAGRRPHYSTSRCYALERRTCTARALSRSACGAADTDSACHGATCVTFSQRRHGRASEAEPWNCAGAARVCLAF